MYIEEYFVIEGTYELKNGVYNVKGSVRLDKQVEKLPVKFGKVTGDFYCHLNDLISLKGCPTHIGGSLYCHYNDLISLKGCPKYVGGNFYCHSNNSLTSLKGAPKQVTGNFYCDENDLTSLEGAPKSVGGNFYCDDYLKNTKEYLQYKIIEKLRS